MTPQHKGSVHYTGWNDSKKVVFGSNFGGGDEASVFRWSAGSRQRAQVPAPKVAKLYNEHKSGADSGKAVTFSLAQLILDGLHYRPVGHLQSGPVPGSGLRLRKQKAKRLE